jgi:hypothetical protein
VIKRQKRHLHIVYSDMDFPEPWYLKAMPWTVGPIGAYLFYRLLKALLG